jgi:hypothetical protein
VKYSIDTSGILDGWRHYPPDIFPPVWERFESLITSGDARASDEVLRELKKKEGDETYAWCSAHPAMFLPLDAEIQQSVTEILAVHPRLVESGGKRSAADAFVIAVARLHKCAVVTGESPSGKIHKPRIPDVCDALGIEVLTLLGVFRREGWTFG